VRSALSEQDLYLFNEGTHVLLYDKLGCRLDSRGAGFAVWAPNARSVAVFGDFNEWDKRRSPLRPVGTSGIWEGYLEGVRRGDRYKYHIVSGAGNYRVDKADPFGLMHEAPPATGSVAWDLSYEWGDREWMAVRGSRQRLDSAISIYEVHLGSWRRRPEEGDRPLGYAEIAPYLVEHVRKLGFTHVEFLPVMEHPFYGSWGYQTTGFFAPTRRYGTPQDFMRLIDLLHQNEIGVILDWVPSHFPADEHGLAYFDGTHLFEHSDPRQGFHPQWKSSIFNYGRHEVRSFLLSSALFWLDRYHADGLRVDAVASMLYLDYGRGDGEWIPNERGGRENLEAISFLRQLNQAAYRDYPDIQMIAEESTSWPKVSRPLYEDGLGFGLKWDMGWMHDTLSYFGRFPVHRRFHHGEVTFRQLYAHHENFVLPLSHDEVVYGKGSLLQKMAGDRWQKFANLRLLLAYQFAQSGKKHLFMGGEFGQENEWYHERSLDWHLLEDPAHRGVQALVADLNRLYRRFPAMHRGDCGTEGFQWIDCDDAENSVLTLLRLGDGGCVLAALNFTPVPRHGYRVGVPSGGLWNEVLNTDAAVYGGANLGNLGGVLASNLPWNNRPCSIELTLPPLAAVFFSPSWPSEV
jgi:1,4-alpha-glucan branching enzyme